MAPETNIDHLDHSVHQANEWINELAPDVAEDRQATYRALRAFLRTLRDRLTVEEGAHLASQLPHLWRGVFYDGWVPARTPDTYRDGETFLRRFADDAQLPESVDPASVVGACARVVRGHIDSGEFSHVLDVLPEPVAARLS